MANQYRHHLLASSQYGLRILLVMIALLVLLNSETESWLVSLFGLLKTLLFTALALFATSKHYEERFKNLKDKVPPQLSRLMQTLWIVSAILEDIVHT